MQEVGTKPTTPEHTIQGGSMHYLLVIENDVEPQLKGPFSKSNDRDLSAIQHRINDPEKCDGLFRLDIKDNIPTVSSFAACELPEDTDEEENECA